MPEIWLSSILSVVIISLVSLIGVFTLAVNFEKLRHFLLFMVAFAAGALLGDAFIHILPETFEGSEDLLLTSSFILIGIVVFFFLEKVIFWRHCHLPTTNTHPHHVGLLNLVGDALHNFLDGIIIAGSFLVSPALGVTTSIAVFLHEVPQEVGDFSILIHAGYTKRRALFFNFLSATTAILGAVVTLLVGSKIDHATSFLLPFTAGAFIYIATSDLLPEIHRERNSVHSFWQFLFFLVGILIMFLLLTLE